MFWTCSKIWDGLPNQSELARMQYERYECTSNQPECTTNHDSYNIWADLGSVWLGHNESCWWSVEQRSCSQSVFAVVLALLFIECTHLKAPLTFSTSRPVCLSNTHCFIAFEHWPAFFGSKVCLSKLGSKLKNSKKNFREKNWLWFWLLFSISCCFSSPNQNKFCNHR